MSDQTFAYHSRKSGEELCVAETATLLGVTERTVLNFIQSKQIMAIKVGKSWFVDKASVQAFRDSRHRVAVTPALSPEPPAIPTEVLKESKPSKQGLVGLNCYRLALNIFGHDAWIQLTSLETKAALGCISAQVLLGRLVHLQLQILEALGAGYHTFSHTKVIEYGRARAAAGSLMALIASHPAILSLLQAEYSAIEAKLLPALIALQRTAEKRGRA